MADNSEFCQVACLKNVCDADPEDARLADYAMLLYGQALLAEGATSKTRRPSAAASRS
jgi:hypothetical protein